MDEHPYAVYPESPRKTIHAEETLAVGQFHGIGKVTAEKMNRLGIFTGLDLRHQTEKFLQQHFGKVGGYHFLIARAIDHRPVNPDRIRKSVGSENTFDHDLETRAELERAWYPCSMTSGGTAAVPRFLAAR